MVKLTLCDDRRSTGHRPFRLVLIAIAFLTSSVHCQVQSLGAKDTFAAAKLSAKEIREVVANVERLAFDTPDSFDEELRVRRVNLGARPGLVLQGTHLLCGATGNCQIFVFQRVDDAWVPLFATDQAPLAEGFQFGPGSTRGIENLTIVVNSSAETGRRVTYRFDGHVYRAN